MSDWRVKFFSREEIEYTFDALIRNLKSMGENNQDVQFAVVRAKESKMWALAAYDAFTKYER